MKRIAFNENLFQQMFKEKQSYVERCLHDSFARIKGYPPIIHEAMHYALFNGGKRIRPILVLEGARLAGGKPEDVVLTACAVEMIHCYSLVHDDLPAMDNDDFRRGKPTCHKVYGDAVAILTGDALLTAAFELMACNAEVPGIMPQNVARAIAEVAEAAGSRGMIGGQVIDLGTEGKKIDYATLKTMHRLKTGELFKASLKAGAILQGMPEDKLQCLEDYAYNFGLAFQITDDILDVKGDQNITGKPIGSDEKNRRTTYVSLFGIEKAWDMAEERIEECIDSLRDFGEEAEFLRQLACFVLYRNY
ncbi:farnesyl-diphosphate synthase [Thermosyntropha lipolytica DSM 11003]|uniref:Farnesyl diphosphate synthase n=1 Tax=Thermosyntropha lipolytica DSM 11003 TaxID=1123382 RepID=A0A1M5LIG9_9FIRM|nr:farnesyl diphosphate synthase [Thermosyntropha lipolytica]SHG64841.1 farnesyl-diphosphate synthase [Thermosyntropha lipolytica DSM 11003]